MSSPTAILLADTPVQQQRAPTVDLRPWLFAAGVLVFAWFGLWNKLRVDWTINDQYQYGWCVPPLALILLAMRWADRPPAAPNSRPASWILALVAIVSFISLWPVRLIEEPNPDWRLLYWFHAGLLLVISLATGLWMGGWSWARHFAFPTGFLLLAIPWPSGPEQAIVQSLMRVVAEISSEAMNVIGVPAVAQGNVIHVHDQTLGVDEACSGIRSLQTMIMGALLFGEVSRLRGSGRFALLGGGVAVAMAANVFRCSLLVWITANYGNAAMERFHDSAGLAVVFIVFAGLGWINHLLTRGSRRIPQVNYTKNHPSGPLAFVPRAVPVSFLAVAAFWLAASEAGTAAWYGVLAPTRNPLPSWTVVPPENAPGLQSNKIDSRTSQLLRFDEGISNQWTRPGPPPENCTLFFFRWEPGHASAAQANMHQPHICLTASGLTEIADWGIQPLPLPGGITLPVRRYEFALHGQSIYVFFVVWQDGVDARHASEPPGTRWSRLQPVLEHCANTGRQTLEFIVTGSANAGEANERFQQEIAGMVSPLSPHGGS